jgi:hypothetical protein
MNRRRFNLTVMGATGVALAELFPTLAAPKADLCHPCHGHGNCQSGFCDGGICMPTDDVCGGPKRTFTCKGREPACCRRKRGCRRM